jgi:hypothetical protein
VSALRRTSFQMIAANIAPEVLRRDGMPSIWQLHLAAAAAHRDGEPREAENLIEIADAVENAWRRAAQFSAAQT